MLDLKPGVHEIPEDEYHQLTAFSNSDLKLIARSPAHYYAARLDPERPPDKPTPAKIAGRILHCAILEPETFHSKFVVVPEDAPRKPSSTQRNAKNPSEDSIRSVLWWDEWEIQNGDKQTIKYDDQVAYQKIANSIRNHPELVNLFANARTEQTFIAEDPITGVLVRCRTDLLNVIGQYHIALDMKSCEDAQPLAFSRAAFVYGYFHQDAFYRDVIDWSGYRKLDVFLFAAFEKEPPYAVKLYQSTDTAIERARASYRKALNTAAECLNTGKWPAYTTDIETLDYPAWVRD